MGRLATALLTGLLALALLAGCGGGDGGEAADPTAEPTTGDTAPGEGNAAAGKEIFSSAGCGNCHVLEEAGSSGTVGPNLDEAELELTEVVEQVRDGGGGMPSFEDDLTPREITDVSAFVAESSGG